ncbi:restriction endonuclease [Mucilaginibacter sp. Bleaf8]|uniref:restriction endonuclease n=1 Tax=Mucilaginibacter sp. Bleaf8 TaxID=2834430 RepID=UPI001BCD3A63|nr:restriction endonuclease [Mucilaginibacter sp. Bleaf8]MBS7565337.1 restriction endonuclease [Mucilaginibacter sp. Bleaf8]
MNPSHTTNRLHFNDLDPLRFEDLCLNIISRHYSWKELVPVGRKGTDGGVDIIGVRKDNDQLITYYIQCKRYATIVKRDITLLVDKVAANATKPDVLWVIIACDISRTNFEYLKSYAISKGISSVELWTGQTLEAKLYEKYQDLLLIYFGQGIHVQRQFNIKNLKAGLKMEKRVKKELLDLEFIKDPQNREQLMNDPSSKFISDRVLIRSIDDTSYPNIPELLPGQFNPYYRTYFYDLYETGIEFWLGAALGADVIMDKDGFWEPILNSRDERLSDPNFTVIQAKQIGRIAYKDIIELKPEGDNRYTEPHIICRFDYDGMPYEEIYFKSHGKAIGRFDWDCDKSKRTVFK